MGQLKGTEDFIPFPRDSTHHLARLHRFRWHIIIYGKISFYDAETPS